MTSITGPRYPYLSTTSLNSTYSVPLSLFSVKVYNDELQICVRLSKEICVMGKRRIPDQTFRDLKNGIL